MMSEDDPLWKVPVGNEEVTFKLSFTTSRDVKEL